MPALRPCPERTCSSSLTWQPSSTTTACTWLTTCSPWATTLKLTCRSNTAWARPRLSTWCPDSGSWVMLHLSSLLVGVMISVRCGVKNKALQIVSKQNKRDGAFLIFCSKMISFGLCSPGAHCFLAQLNVQKGELLERLSTAHNFCNLDDDDNYIAASKAVRQVRTLLSSVCLQSVFSTLITPLAPPTSPSQSHHITGHPPVKAAGHRVAGRSSSQYLL